MADLGDAGSVVAASTTGWFGGHASPVWPDVGNGVLSGHSLASAPRRNATKEPVSAVIVIPWSGIVVLTESGRFVDVTAGSDGYARFYAVPDGTFYAHAAKGARAWRATVVGEDVTIEDVRDGIIFGTRAFGFIS